MNISLINPEQALSALMKHKYSAQPGYLAMYSSWLGGVVKEPGLMIVPVDDHLVHRGDGVFEAIKTVNRKVYLLQAHIDRLFSSAEALSIECPYSKSQLKEIILQTLKIANAPNTVVRLFLSRGPGQFTTNPYDSVGAQVYVIITELKALPEDKVKNGVRIGVSAVPVKSSWLAKVKTCNYLPNVMMKKESVDQGLDYTVAFDADGFLAESSTENLIFIDSQGVLCHPYLDHILKGTTMTRLFDLVEQNKIRAVHRQAKVDQKQLQNAQALFLAGTTLDILPVKEFAGKTFKVSETAAQLLQLIQQDQKNISEFTAEF
jgi:branched-chain amino acid aminotransferase